MNFLFQKLSTTNETWDHSEEDQTNTDGDHTLDIVKCRKDWKINSSDQHKWNYLTDFCTIKQRFTFLQSSFICRLTYFWRHIVETTAWRRSCFLRNQHRSSPALCEFIVSDLSQSNIFLFLQRFSKFCWIFWWMWPISEKCW